MAIYVNATNKRYDYLHAKKWYFTFIHIHYKNFLSIIVKKMESDEELIYTSSDDDCLGGGNDESSDEDTDNVAQPIHSDGKIGDWDLLHNASEEVRIHIGNVDRHLLNCAYDEIEAIVSQLSHRLSIKQNANGNFNVIPSIEEMVTLWMDSVFIHQLFDYMNTNLGSYGRTQMDMHELSNFIQVEMMLSFYRISPGEYYKQSRINAYGRGHFGGLTYNRYKELISALEHSKKDVEYNPRKWKVPYAYNSDLKDLQRTICRICTKFGFAGIHSKTILSADDDKLKLRSKKVEDEGLKRTKTKAGAFGPVMHGVVSLTTNMFLGGIIAGDKMGAEDCMKINLYEMSGELDQSKIDFLYNSIFVFDRGYSSLKLMKRACEYKLRIHGTVKRGGNFAFTFVEKGKKARSKTKICISESGMKSAYWSKRYLKSFHIKCNINLYFFNISQKLLWKYVIWYGI